VNAQRTAAETFPAVSPGAQRVAAGGNSFSCLLPLSLNQLSPSAPDFEPLVAREWLNPR
jgi:hypothetical protein